MRKCGTRSKLTRDPQSLPTEIHILIHKPTIHPSMERKTQKELSNKRIYSFTRGMVLPVSVSSARDRQRRELFRRWQKKLYGKQIEITSYLFCFLSDLSVFFLNLFSVFSPALCFHSLFSDFLFALFLFRFFFISYKMPLLRRGI